MKACGFLLLVPALLLLFPTLTHGMTFASGLTYVNEIHIACEVSRSPIAATPVRAASLCKAAQAALVDLGMGRMNREVQRLPSWSGIGDPSARDRCLQQYGGIAGACDWNRYELSHKDRLLPVSIVEPNTPEEEKPTVLKVIVIAQAARERKAAISVSIEIAEPANSIVPSSARKVLPPIELDASELRLPALRDRFQIGLARYFSPEALNRIMANAVLMKRSFQ